MEKLIELLNEYEIKRMKTKMDITDKRTEGDLDNEYTPLIIISKKFGFIKWLVENDKIDREQFYDKARKIITDFDLKGEYEGACNEIIMLLSISDTPIEDLLLYLK